MNWDTFKKIITPEFHDFFHRLLEEVPPLDWKLRRASPHRTLPVSLTGTECRLNCSHCGGHYLEGMTPWKNLSPRALRTPSQREFAANVLGTRSSVLLSGGCDRAGRVPIADHISEIQDLPGHLRINLHVGLQKARDLLSLKSRNITVSFDLVGDDETIKEVYGLSATSEDYFATYLDLGRHFPVIPHITVGLRGGTISGENRVLDFLEKHPPEAVTFLVFRPTPKTAYATCQPPHIADVVPLILRAAQTLRCPVHLGCMRPAGNYRARLDPLAWLAGARTIVMPDRRLVSTLEQLGVPIEDADECCSLRKSDPA